MKAAESIFSHPYYGDRLQETSQLQERPSLGRLLDYDLVQQLQHGLTEVFLVRDPKRGEHHGLYVLKTLYDRTASASAEARLLREAHVAFQFGGTGLLELESVERNPNKLEDPRLFLKFRYCEGGSLSDRMKRGQLSTRENIYILLGMAHALAILHGESFAHGDLKPDNVLFCFGNRNSSSTEWELVLSDFGFASTPESAQAEVLSFAAAPYAAPELSAGTPKSFASDIWAWGLIGLELLGENMAGRAFPPMADESMVFALPAQCESLIAQRVDQLKSVAEPLRNLIQRALSRDPALRPSAKEIVYAFSSICSFRTTQGVGTLLAEKREDEHIYFFPMDSLGSDLIHRFDWGLDSSNATKLEFDFGWLTRLERARELLGIGSLLAVHESLTILEAMVGGWDLSGSPLAEILRQPDAESYAYNLSDKGRVSATEGHRLIQLGSQIPAMTVLEIVDLICLGLISVVENSGEEEAVERLHKFVEGYKRLSQFKDIHACLHLGQALALLGDLNSATFFLDAVRSKSPRDILLLSTSGRLLASQSLYKESADLFMAAAEQAIINDENPNAFVINAAGSLGQSGFILGVPVMLSSFGLDNSDIGVCFRLVALARISDERRWEEWRAVRNLLLREAYPSPEKLRFALECAWYYGEKDLCIHRSRIMLLDLRMKLWTNKHLSAFFELMSQGMNLNSLSVLDEIEWLAGRWNLNNRRSEYLLSGLRLAAMKIWSYRNNVSETVSSFLETAYSLQDPDWYDDLMNMRSRCGICETRYRVENLGICTRCGGLSCFECEGSGSEIGLPAGKCGCGGSIVG